MKKQPIKAKVVQQKKLKLPVRYVRAWDGVSEQYDGWITSNAFESPPPAIRGTTIYELPPPEDE